ncbi:MAG: hypothetical protein ABW061_16125 [Polyangiaceae bacterium]
MTEAAVARPQGANLFRVVGSIIAVALVAPALMMLSLPVVAAIVIGPFMYIDARGMPVEPAWAGHIALFGDVVVISSIAGALLGRVHGIRSSHAAIAGVLTGLSGVLEHYAKETVRRLIGFGALPQLSTRDFAVLLGVLALFACNRKTDAPAGPTGELSSAPTAAAGQAPEARPDARVSESENGEPILVAGRSTGYSQLRDGLVVRTAKQTCPSSLPRPEECHSTRRGCKTDAECKAKPNGHCTDIGDSLGCGCRYGCLNDEECGQNEVCLCAAPAGSCVAVTCSTETCAAPQCCATYHNGCFYQPFSCREHAGARTCTF